MPNELKTGIQFYVVFEKNPCNGEYEKLFPYWDEYHIRSSHVTDHLTQRDDLTPEQVLAGLYIAEKVWVKNTHIFYDTNTFYPLADFMKERDPDNFSRIQEFNNLFIFDEEDERFD